MDSQNNPQPPTEEESLAKWEGSWKEEEKSITYPYSRKEFTLSKVELRQLLQQGTMEAMGMKITEFARAASNDIINIHVLPRVGIDPNPTIRILYDLNSGRFMVWIPKEEKPSDTPKGEETTPEQP